MIQSGNEQCPLCSAADICFFHQNQKRVYLRCDCCRLVFVTKQQRLSLKKEREQYDLHQNLIDDVYYRQFLSRIFNPITEAISAPATVLDFGCGPGPALAAMFVESGYEVDLYDPYFYPDANVFQKHYQIIVLTEVIEHLFYPMDELLRLKSMLLPSGIIGIMTKRLTKDKEFPSWHYKNDPTHVCFYSENTFKWIANRLEMQLQIHTNDSLILKA